LPPRRTDSTISYFCNRSAFSIRTIKLKQLSKLFINHIDAWGVALIITSLALLVHDAISLRTIPIMLAIAGAYWMGFAYNDYKDAKTEPNFTTWIGPDRALFLLRAATIVLVLLGLTLAGMGIISSYMIPLGLIAAPMLAFRFIRKPGQYKNRRVTIGTLTACLLYAGTVFTISFVR